VTSWQAWIFDTGKAHVFTDGGVRALCGMAGPYLHGDPTLLPDPIRRWQERRIGRWQERWVAVPSEVKLSGDVCKTCLRSWFATHDQDQFMPEIEPGAALRGTQIPRANVREIPGRIFRVAGERDIYTVTVPADQDLASVCTCMAAKTNPNIMCKHQVAVFATDNEERMAI